MAVSKPLLLLDNASMLALLHQGCFRLQEISFEEVKAILEMHGSREVVRCFSNVQMLVQQLFDLGVGKAPDDLTAAVHFKDGFYFLERDLL